MKALSRVCRVAPVLAIALASCAKEEMPPGTGPDFEPPRVVEMFPAHATAVPGLSEDARIRFDEPLGDPRSVARTVQSSPAWLYDISAGRRDVRIRPRDGWRAGVVYMFRIPPGLRDLVRNQTREPIEFLFTTGEMLSGTRTTGRVWDRETVRTVRDAAVQIIGGDSVPYAAVTDTSGSFALPSLPTGQYWAFAYRDQNRNRVLDREFESYDSARVSLPDTAASAHLEMWLVAPDSTAPMLTSAEATDSLRLRLEFDDLLEPEAPLDEATIAVRRADSGEAWPIAEFVVGALTTVDTASDEAAMPDSLARQELPEDSVPPPQPEGAGDRPGERGVPPQRVTERARPQAFVSVRLGRTMEDGQYEIRATGFVNLRMLSGGGDTTLVYEAPPPTPPPEGEAEEAAEGT